MIPLSIPHLSGNEWKYVKECLDTGWISSAGAYVSKFEKLVAEYAGMNIGVAAVNGTSGLHLALHCLGIGRGDKVIVPNITFIASANSVLYTGAEPIFIDIDPSTWQMDLDLLEDFLSSEASSDSSIKAIMPVHVLGNMCDMNRLMEIADQFNLHVIEDATESLGSYCRGKHSGAFGTVSVFSFNGNKIISTGGGGVIVSNDSELMVRAKHLSTQSKVDPETYYHDEMGFNYRLVNILAAVGVAQMEQLPDFISKKKKIDQKYREALGNTGDIVFQKVEDYVDPNCWLFTFRSSRKNDVLSQLKNNQVIARPFWTPMNQLPMFEKSRYIHNSDHSRVIHDECLSIPSSVSLSASDQETVIRLIKKVYE